MKEFESWWTIPKWNMTICLPPRCGSSTVLHYLVNEGIFALRPARASGRMIMVVRDPVSRFKSLWKSKCRDEEGLWIDDEENRNVTHDIRGMTPEELITLIENDTDPDAHWAKLVDIEAGLSTHTVRLKDLSEFLGIPREENMNVTEGVVKLDKKTEARVKAWYADDYELL